MSETARLYLLDNPVYSADAIIVGIRDNEMAFHQSPFYPGGGGQPADEGEVHFHDGTMLKIVSAYSDSEGIIWHKLISKAPQDVAGQVAHLKIDTKKRLALTRYHTVLHILNTTALHTYNAWITGVQIGTEYSRIDFKFENFSPEIVPVLEESVNNVLTKNHPIKAYYISEDEFSSRTDLLRTLTVKPPIHNNQVRVVEIEGFDAQACGGTHVHSTGEIGRLSIFRIDNKGRINKRLYIRLE